MKISIMRTTAVIFRRSQGIAWKSRSKILIPDQPCIFESDSILVDSRIRGQQGQYPLTEDS